jgi:CAAX prenyl protease-like protein
MSQSESPALGPPGRGTHAGDEPGTHGPGRPWVTCLAPLVTYMLAGSLLPSAEGGGLAGSLGIPFSAYPWVYGLQVVATLIAIGWCWRDLAPWLGRPTWWPPLVGVALVVPWVVLATLQRDSGWLIGFGARAGFNPFAALGAGTAASWAFLAVRALGLVVAVPIAEELFLRGFLMRYVVNEDFWRVPFGTLTAAAAAACVGYGVATHPAEAVAAAVWFASVTGIAAATRKPIDCILAHAGTNFALGAYVLATGNWWLA